MALSTPPTAPQRGDRTTFASRVDAFITWLIGFVSELNIFSANLNSIAAGGAYAIPFTFSGLTANSDPGAGVLRLSPSNNQNQCTAIYLDPIGADGRDYTSIIDTFDASSNTVKGSVRIVKVGDSSKFLTFDVTARGTPTGYRSLSIANTGGSAISPFVTGDSVIMFFQRAGDKGDQGAAFIPQTAKFSDRKTTSTSGGVSTGNSTAQVRTLNTTDQNTIPSGVALASNRVTVPAGTYDVRGRVPAYAVGTHRAFLWNVTSGALALLGSSAHSSSGGSSSDSEFTGRLVLGASTQFEVRHYTSIGSNSTDLGVATGVSGQVEVYTEVEFIKVA